MIWKHWFGVAVAALVVVMGAAMVTSALQETQTWDEGIHLSAGYSYLKTGDFRLNPEHPPLFKLLCALPLLTLHPRLPSDARLFKSSEEAVYGDQFLYQNTVSPETMLFCARLVSIALTLGFGLAVALWTRRKFGSAAAIGALVLFAFDPNLIAHGHYVTNDVMAAAAIFLATITWAHYLETTRWRDLLVASLVLGLALVSKFSTVFLLPLFAAMYWFRRWQVGRGRLSEEHFAVTVVVAGLVSALVVGLVYGPATLHSFRGPKLQEVVARGTTAGDFAYSVGKRLGLPAHPLLVGLYEFALHDESGHSAYLMGQWSDTGWWYYFPVVFAVKTPAAVLALLAIALALGLAALMRTKLRRWRLREVPFAWVIVLLPPVVYFALCMRSHVNIGVRHLLPIYPFLYIALAAALSRGRWRARALLAGLALVAVESAAIYPHYLAFFNVFAGGPNNGPRYLVDSNLDWGQDLKNLKLYASAHGIKKLCICYFGRSSMSYYKFEYTDVPETRDVARRASMDCVAAVSATPLAGSYVGADAFRWLRERKPMAKIGYSIYLYDLRKSKSEKR
jgi:dolichyl-phosphate-mannose--protein O-mannosyl transferase